MSSTNSLVDNLRMMESVEINPNNFNTNSSYTTNSGILDRSQFLNTNNDISITPSSQDSKKMYQEFVKIMLKVKFEKFNNSHSGQKIPEKVLFRECMRQKVDKKNWPDFIVRELQQSSKYADFIKKENKSKNNKLGRTSQNLMTINEEYH